MGEGTGHWSSPKQGAGAEEDLGVQENGKQGSSHTAVVTGAAGFVGQALVRRLLSEGEAVRAVVLRGDPLGKELVDLAAGAPALEVIWGDVCDYASMASAFEGASRVFHAAAMVHSWVPRQRYREVNVSGSHNVARAAVAAGVERLVAVSTSDVFGLPRGAAVLDESSPLRPWGEPYADTKIEAERLLWKEHGEGGLPLSVIYPGWVYGPGDRAFFPGLAKAIAGGTMFFCSHGARLPFVYIDNLVDGCLLASRHSDALGQGYLIYDGDDGPTLEELCARIAARIGAKPPTVHVPFRLALCAAWGAQSLWRALSLRGAPPVTTTDIKAFGYQWRFSNAKARRQLGWTPRVCIEEGMARAVEALPRGPA
jgi:nucleoside-diphosphate-sugar epimerase